MYSGSPHDAVSICLVVCMSKILCKSFEGLGYKLSTCSVKPSLNPFKCLFYAENYLTDRAYIGEVPVRMSEF